MKPEMNPKETTSYIYIYNHKETINETLKKKLKAALNDIPKKPKTTLNKNTK